MATKYSFIVCINNEIKYKKIAFASMQKFIRNDLAEIIEINNIHNNLSVPSALNRGLQQAKGEYVIFFHQDVYFPEDWIERLDEQLSIIKKLAPNWGVLGVFGIGYDHLPCGHVIHQGRLLKKGSLPAAVQSLDEVCIIINKNSGLKFNEELNSHHLIATELCLQAEEKGLTCFAIDACIEYISSTQGLDKSFWVAANKLKSLYRSKTVPVVICTPCAVIKLKNTIGSFLEFRKVKTLRRKIKKSLRKQRIYPVYDLNQKPDGYYSSPRFEMLSYISNEPQKTLEIGSGEGFFSLEVNSRYGCETWAIEYDSKAAQMAQRYLDHVFCGDATQLVRDLPNRQFDAIFCFDLLEHLINPFQFLLDLKDKLSDQGLLIASIPNIRHYKTLSDLLLKGNWTYHNAGTLDITHLRFFTYNSIIQTFEHLGFKILKIEGIHKSRNKKVSLLSGLSCGKFEDIKYLQFAVVAEPK